MSLSKIGCKNIHFTLEQRRLLKFGPNASRRLKGHTYSYEGPKSQFKGLQRDAYKFIIQNDIQILKCNFYLSNPEL